ncbi:MAG: hypothetical protein IJG45_06695 [Oscillospiraceae bacterium]|nr:hypothetical protein [Oscillospiraceae bacterium]
MKKSLLLMLLVCMLLLSGCSAALSNNSESVRLPASSDNLCDVDLTVLSSTMVYSEVFQMISAPESYLGKTVRMRGSFAVYEGSSRNYFACLIADATACCAQGIEFVLRDHRVYPAEYPEKGEEITVVGVFDVYKEGSNQFCQLVDAVIES